MTERQLIEACLRLDRTAQYELVRRFGPRLLTVCRRFTPPGRDAQDSLQEAFVLVFRHLDRFDTERGALWPWMKTVAIRETLKRHRRKDPLVFPEPSAEEGWSTPSEEAGPLALEAEYLLDLIARLPDGYREVFNLVAIEGYSHEECAALLGISPGTSRSALSRARRQLQLQYPKIIQS